MSGSVDAQAVFKTDQGARRVAVVIRAGIPASHQGRGQGEPIYPDSVTDVAKLLRQEGVEVSYEHDRDQRKILSLNSAEVWIPVLAFVTDVGVNVPANIVATMIVNYFGGRSRAEKSVLHVEFEESTPDGSQRKFNASGPGALVLEAIDKFGRQEDV
ncbi:hypothetical protein [Lentzea fradiae]|uniref:hypothetical protein n=1 Tax=Lentzea fradiae TaxID=200378 RepID=UPI00115FAAE9|nr:hypothetical protein [Lentzea fradiae]